MKTDWNIRLDKGELKLIRFNNGYVIVGILGDATTSTIEIKAPLYLMEDPDAPASDALYNFNQNSNNTVAEFKIKDIFTVQNAASHIEKGYITLAAAILKGPTDLAASAELETQKILGKIIKR